MESSLEEILGKRNKLVKAWIQFRHFFGLFDTVSITTFGCTHDWFAETPNWGSGGATIMRVWLAGWWQQQVVVWLGVEKIWYAITHRLDPCFGDCRFNALDAGRSMRWWWWWGCCYWMVTRGGGGSELTQTEVVACRRQTHILWPQLVPESQTQGTGEWLRRSLNLKTTHQRHGATGLFWEQTELHISGHSLFGQSFAILAK